MFHQLKQDKNLQPRRANVISPPESPTKDERKRLCKHIEFLLKLSMNSLIYQPVQQPANMKHGQSLHRF